MPGGENAFRAACACSVATFSFRATLFILPTLIAIKSPPGPSIHLTGSVRKGFNASGPGAERLSTSSTALSRTGVTPHSKSRPPPNFLGMFSMSIKAERVGRTSFSGMMKIFEVVIGSNHFLIQPQTVGKNEGAPIICQDEFLVSQPLNYKIKRAP